LDEQFRVIRKTEPLLISLASKLLAIVMSSVLTTSFVYALQVCRSSTTSWITLLVFFGSKRKPKLHELAPLSSASLRRYACSALSPMTCASAVSVISRGKIGDVACPITEAGAEAVNGGNPQSSCAQDHFHGHIGKRLVLACPAKRNRRLDLFKVSQD